MARPARIERATLCLEGRCSIQLSYGRYQNKSKRHFHSAFCVYKRQIHLLAEPTRAVAEGKVVRFAFLNERRLVEHFRSTKEGGKL
jgi:hypothetical protein